MGKSVGSCTSPRTPLKLMLGDFSASLACEIVPKLSPTVFGADWSPEDCALKAFRTRPVALLTGLVGVLRIFFLASAG
jgi:hypothetical protein